MAAVQGVETNESSRFIDHTQATPWETLIADIEKALKLLSKSQSKVEITYLEYGLTIEKMKANSNRNKKDVSKSLSIHDSLWLSKTFNARIYILVSCTGPATVEYPAALRMTILSAFASAVKTICSALTIPAFFTYSVVSDVGQIKELVGYQIFNKSVNPKEKELRYCRYESYLYDKINSKHYLYFFDGIRKIFYKKLSLVMNPLLGDVQQQVAALAENYRVTAMNSYLYKMMDYKQLLSEPPQYGDVDANTNSRTVFSGEFNRLLIFLCAQNLTKSLHLSHILVKLQYKEQKQTSVIDNDAYSTFIPSKQPPSSWKISSYFRVSSSALKIDTFSAAAAQAVNSLIGHTPMGHVQDLSSMLPSTTTSCWMAYCIRRLLVFFIASIYNKREDLVNMDKLANHRYLNSELLDRSTVDKLIVMLSIESQNTFRNMFIPPTLPSDMKSQSDLNSSSVAATAAGGGGGGGPAAGGGARDRSLSTPSPGGGVGSGADDEEWVEQESCEVIREIMNFLYETEETKLRKARSHSRATTDDGLSGGYTGGGGLGTGGHHSLTSPMLGYAINRAAGVNLNNVVTAAAAVSDCQSESIGYFMSLFSVLGSCMNGAGTTGQSDVFSLAKLWNCVLRESHNSWEFGNTLKTFIPPLGENSPLTSTDYSGAGAAPGGVSGGMSVGMSGLNSSTENLHSLAGGRSHAPPPSFGTPPSHQSQQQQPQPQLQQLPPRNHHQYGTYAKFLVSTSTSSSTSAVLLPNDENKLPICSRQLWQDLIDKKKVREGLHIALPDRSETIVIQKLQMLQFCIAMKNESVIYRFRNNVSPTPPGAEKSIISPRLYRRLPLTEDAIEMQERISKKVSNDSSKSGKEHPLLKWQVVMPSLISDLNAFKAANAGADLTAFLTWYGVTVYDTPPPSAAGAGSSRPSSAVASTPVHGLTKRAAAAAAPPPPPPGAIDTSEGATAAAPPAFPSPVNILGSEEGRHLLLSVSSMQSVMSTLEQEQPRGPPALAPTANAATAAVAAGVVPVSGVGGDLSVTPSLDADELRSASGSVLDSSISPITPSAVTDDNSAATNALASSLGATGIAMAPSAAALNAATAAGASQSAAPVGPMTSLGIPYATLVEIWNTCEGVHCEAQKPLFQAEKEAEKALAYLEKIPFTQFTCTLLSNVIKFVFHLLNTKVNYWMALSSSGASAPPPPAPPAAPSSPLLTGEHVRHRSSKGGSFSSVAGAAAAATAATQSEHLTANLMSDLLLLQEQIEKAVVQLKTQSTQTARDEGTTSAIIILIDSIAGLVEKLENVCLKADEIDSLFKACMSTAASNIVAATGSSSSSGTSTSRSGKHNTPSSGAKEAARAVAAANHKLADMHRMLVSLALRDNFFVERDEEVASLMDFIKVLNMQSDSNWGPQGAHAWHSYDGRELGLPTSKSYSLRVAAPAAASGGSGILPAAPSSPMGPGGHAMMSSPSAAGISGKHFVALSSASRAESNDFRANNSDNESPVPVAPSDVTSGGFGGGAAGGRGDGLGAMKFVSDFQMDAVIQQNIMRISFKIPESE